MSGIHRAAIPCAVVLGALLAASAAGSGAEALPGLRTREQFRQRVFILNPRTAPEIGVESTRRLRADARAAFGDEDPATFHDGTLLGIRVGDWSFEEPLSSDPRWRPGRRSARFLVISGDASAPVRARVRARWDAEEVRVKARVEGVTPLAEGLFDADEAGPVTAPLSGALRMGAARSVFGGDATGLLTRNDGIVLGLPLRLARLDLFGSARVLEDDEDPVPPVVQVASPGPGAILPVEPIFFQGSVRDDRTLERVTYSLGAGPVIQVPILRDPDTGYLDDVVGTFSFPLEPVLGENSVTVTVYDAAGNSDSTTIPFIVSVPRALPLAAGDGHAVSTNAEGGVVAWGSQGYDPYPPGGGFGPAPVLEPTEVPGLADVEALAAGYGFTLALLEDGTIAGYGNNGAYQLGVAPAVAYRDAVAAVPGIDGVVAVAAGALHAMALRADGSVWVWGNNGFGTFGIDPAVLYNRETPAAVPGLPPIVAIASGSYSCFALDEEGFVWAWGSNLFGELGLTALSPQSRFTPAKLAGVSDAVSIASSAYHGVAIRSDGTAMGWGYNLYGQAGHAGGTAPGVIAGVAGAKVAACGGSHTLILRDDGTVLAFGWNSYGQLGNGLATAFDGVIANRTVPEAVAGLSGVTSIAAGPETSYAALSDGTLRAWGRNGNGRIGDGTLEHRFVPTVVLTDP